MGSFLLSYATAELSLRAVWCLIGATPRGQHWTPAVTLPHMGCGLGVRRMAVLCTCSMPSMYRSVPHQLMRNKLHNFTTIVSVTVYYQGSYVETYSRFILLQFLWHSHVQSACCHPTRRS
jgi:hypothetical protein